MSLFLGVVITVLVLIVFAIKTFTGRERKCLSAGECPRWYQTSFVFVLIGFQLFSSGMLLFGIIAMLLAVANAETDEWYKHRWPWFIVVILLTRQSNRRY
jgi:hypothetical protein